MTFIVADASEPITVVVRDEGVEVDLGAPADTDQLRVKGDPQSIYVFLTGHSDQGSPIGVEIDGTGDAVDRLNLLIERVRESRLGQLPAGQQGHGVASS